MKNINVICALTMTSALLGCTAPVDSESVGSESVGEAQLEIIDGRPATAADVMSTVALVDDTGPFCTGTVIAPTVVVTAAHCLFNQDNAVVSPDQLQVVSGLLDARQATEEDYLAVADMVAFDAYNHAGEPGPLGRDDDLAVLVLAAPIEREPAPVMTVADFDARVDAGTMLTISGYGQRDVEGTNEALAGQLYIAETPYRERTDYEMLAGGANTPDTCSGDSGGPVYLDVDGTPHLVGVVSRASEGGANPCGAGGVYTLPAAYDDFLQEASSGAYEGAVNLDGSPMDDPQPNDAEAATDAGGCNLGGTSSGAGVSWAMALALGLLARRRRSDRRSR